MHIYHRLLLISFIIFLFLISCQKTHKISLDVISSSDTPEILGQNLISTGLYERDIAISPEGDEIIITLGNIKQNKRCLVSYKEKDNEWGDPEILNISGQYQDIEPFFTHSGNRLFFASDRPVNTDDNTKDYNIWYADREGDKWKKPICLDTIINSQGNEFYPSLSENGNLYFTATKAEGIGREDIFVSEFSDGKWLAPQVLDTMINSVTFEFNAFISPDETTLIFSSFGRPDGMGGGDLYYSKKDEIGKWTKAINMGSPINSTVLDYCPFIDFNTNVFYFTSERYNPMDSILVEINQFKESSFTSQNGLGDIYKMKWDPGKYK